MLKKDLPLDEVVDVAKDSMLDELVEVQEPSHKRSHLQRVWHQIRFVLSRRIH
jgi:hypothetical protein